MTTTVPTLERLELSGKRVLARVDFNVPMNDAGEITDDTRIRAHLPTVRAILEKGGQPILLCHFGRPKGQVVDSLRVASIGARLGELLGSPVRTVSESTGEVAQAAIAEGGVVLLENVRFHPGETKGDAELAKAYAALGDVFVGDAFGAAHRDHASVSGVARLLPSAAGPLMARELAAFEKVLNEPERPLVAILGGAKVSDKLSVIENLLDKVDTLLVGGGMAYTFLKAMGHSIGTSLFEEERLDTCKAALERAQAKGVELCLPTDHVVADRFAADAKAEACGVDIPDGRMGLDIGPDTRKLYADRIAAARTLVWNGPMGVFEMEAFRAGTEAVGRALQSCQGYKVVGGGDSVAAVHLLKLESAVDHISTGGGASLELLEGKDLPGVVALGE